MALMWRHCIYILIDQHWRSAASLAQSQCAQMRPAGSTAPVLVYQDINAMASHVHHDVSDHWQLNRLFRLWTYCSHCCVLVKANFTHIIKVTSLPLGQLRVPVPGKPPWSLTDYSSQKLPRIFNHFFMYSYVNWGGSCCSSIRFLSNGYFLFFRCAYRPQVGPMLAPWTLLSGNHIYWVPPHLKSTLCEGDTCEIIVLFNR